MIITTENFHQLLKLQKMWGPVSIVQYVKNDLVFKERSQHLAIFSDTNVSRSSSKVKVIVRDRERKCWSSGQCDSECHFTE